jgi:hypothetical protein
MLKKTILLVLFLSVTSVAQQTAPTGKITSKSERIDGVTSGSPTPGRTIQHSSATTSPSKSNW